MKLHYLHECYSSFPEFHNVLRERLDQGQIVADCVGLTQSLGLMEPLSGIHIQPDQLLIQPPNFRESLIANGLLSRNRAVLLVLEQIYGSLSRLANQDIYLAEALSGFALWLCGQVGQQRISMSEYLDKAENGSIEVPHQDLCALTYMDESFDLVICNELFEHLRDLEVAFVEISRVLRPGGRLVATCPFAFGQLESVIKAVYDSETGKPFLMTDPEFHGDPIRPSAGSLVYRIPGWEILDMLRETGFSQARIHHIASWKHGVLGSDLPGVMVLEAQR